MAGGQIDIRVEPDVKDFPSKLEGGLSGALGTAAKIGSALGLALGAGTAAKAVMDIGLSFDQQMNTMSAVSQGTAAQMDAVAARARELGSDVDLTGTSASDAAAAMVELAKGGFTVEQSMDAAKGTLQLAAAAQIDAADAATIQSQALQAFSLQAEDAARVSDILAGAANASSAEIGDIAAGLQQAGTVANQFGVSIEDTSTALAMFANAGITGSDAGTLLKSSLLALTDQGAPAQSAMEELGLSVYDLQGNFVGLPSLFDQLADAQANMTPEAYQAATATLFGSDAMRLAGIAAEQGGEGFNALKENVTRAGQAAEVAAAQTQGLPGALERAQNAAEALGHKVYDAIKEPLTDAANSGVDAMENLGPAIESAASLGASAFSTLMAAVTPAIGGLTDLASVVMGLPTPLLAMGAAMPLAKMTGLTGALSTGSGSLRTFGQDVAKHQSYFADMGMEISKTTAVMATMMDKSPTIARMGDAYLTAGAGMREAGQLAKDAAQEHTGLTRVLGTAGGSLKTFGGVAAGVANGGMSLLKSGASGLLSALGGPWGLAIGVASAGLGLLAQKHQEAAAAEQEHKQYQDSLRASLDQTTGAITAQTEELQLNALREKDGMQEAANAAGVSLQTVADATLGNASATQQVNDALDASIESMAASNDSWGKYQDKVEYAGLSYTDLANAAVGAAGAQEKINAAMDDLMPTDAENLDVAIQHITDSMGEGEEQAAKLRKEMDQMSDSFDSEQAGLTEDALNRVKKAIEDTAEAMDLLKDADMKLTGIEGGNITVDVEEGAVTEDTRKKLEELGAAVGKPMNGRVSITFDESSDIIGILDEIGLKLSVPQKGIIQIDNYEASEAQAALETLGITADMLVEHDGKMTLDLNDAELQQRLIDLGLAANIDGQFTLSDNFQQILDGMAGIDGSQLTGDMNVSSNMDRVKQDMDAQDGRQMTSTMTTVYKTFYERYGTPQEVAVGSSSDSYGNSVGNTYGATGGRFTGDLFRYAAGGKHNGYRLPTTGPGTDRVDGFTAFDSMGIPSAHLDAGEWVVNRWSSAKHNDAIYWINRDNVTAAIAALEAKTSGTPGTGLTAGRKGTDGLPALADGGTISRSEKVKRDLAPYDGGEYLMGGFTGYQTDCSGAVSMAVNSWNDTDLFASRMSTATEGPWLTQRGFQDGILPNAMVVAWYDNGGGAYGHTASQLADGTYIESGGNTGQGLTIGGTAGPLEGRGFTNFMSKPLGEDEDEVSESTVTDAAETRAKTAEESEPKLVHTTVTIGPDPVAAAMFNAQNDPDGVLALTRAGDFTDRFGSRYGVDESSDDGLVEFLLWAAGGQDEKDAELAQAFTPENDPRGIRSLVEAGVFTTRFGDAFGVDSNSTLVKAVLDARQGGGINTRRVQAWDEEYGSVDTSVSSIAGKVAKSFAEGAVGDIFAALGVEDDLGPLAQAAIAGVKYAYGIQTGTSITEMRTAVSDTSSTSGLAGASSQLASDSDSTSLSTTAAAATYDPALGVEQWANTVLEALQLTDRPSSESGVTLEQIDIESGGDPEAVNDWDSNASAGTPSGGLLQVIEPTRQAMREMFPEHHKGLVDNLFDPLENIVSGIDWAIYKHGGPSSIWPTTAGYAAGGLFSPLDSGKAAIVPPNTMRLIGDRTDVDEFYLPDTPDSVATGAEWARRRGLQLTIAGNQRRQMTRAFAEAQAAAPAAAPTFTATTNIQGFDRNEVAAGIRMAERRARWKEGFL